MSNNAKRHKQRRPTRKAKQEVGIVVHKDKFKEQSSSFIERFTPTQSQKVFINKIRQNTITFCDAVAGTGKTSSALWYFCQEYLKDSSKKIMVIRTPVEAGQDKIGALPNDKNEKIAPHFTSVKHILCDFLGKGKFEADFDNRIFFDIPNFQLGNTWNDMFVVIDETQAISPSILKLLLERIGKGTKVVVIGCSGQMYAGKKDRDALSDAIYRFFDEYGNPFYDDFALHKFGIDDVMRDDIVKSVIIAYEHNK